MNSLNPMQSRSLHVFLFRPLEIAALITAVLLLLKIAIGSAVKWWIIGLSVAIVPAGFAMLFAVIYILSWIFSKVD